MNRLPLEFYLQKTEIVAQKLLGKTLVFEGPDGLVSGYIVETEAYLGFDDQACHGARGMTQRNKSMFLEAGRVYVYQIYGMYYCLNLVTQIAGIPEAVLIRAVEPLNGIEVMKKNRHINKEKNLCSGPGKLCQAFGITKEQDGWFTTKGMLYVLIDGLQNFDMVTTTRIGITKDADLSLRYYIKGNQYISKK